MGTLLFVGAGLSGISSLSMAAIEAVSSADAVFIDSYTTLLDSSFASDLGKAAGRRCELIGREALERGDALLDAASTGTAVLVVGGDSMSATTHSSLRIEASARGIETRLLFGPSIFTAAPALLGLHQYKFGRTATLPRFQPGYRPVSPFRLIESNMKEGAHTLVLLDVDAEHGYFMSPTEAFSEIIEMGAELSSVLLGEGTFCCTVSRAGGEDCATRAGRISRLRGEDFGAPPHCIVVPGRLHFKEAEALAAFSGAEQLELEGLTD